MPYKLVVPPDMSRALGGLGLGRAGLLAVLNWLHPELEERADNHRHRRDQTHPDLYFWCEVTVWDQERPRRLRFTVDDARAPGHLFLVAVDET